MSRFRSKPVEISAVQLTRELVEKALLDGGNLPMGVEFRGEVYPTDRRFQGNFVCHSANGLVSAELGDWIIVEPMDAALAYPCKPDVFLAKYEAVD